MWITIVYDMWTSYPHLHMDWNSFLQQANNNIDSPVIISILKKTRLSSYENSTARVTCQNNGARLFLEGKRLLLQKLLSIHLQHDVTIVFDVRHNKKNKTINDSSLPLISYQSSFKNILDRSYIQQHFSLENYAVSPANQMAHAAALSVIENPGRQYNPLFIWGGVGVGKTHLMQAIGHGALKKDDKKKVLYCSSEEFTNMLIDRIRTKKTNHFREIFRPLDILMIDDAQFLAGKNSVQEEFYHTFNTIVARGGQIVLTSDKSPNEISRLEDRLRSRFSGGLIVDIGQPDFELRTAILLIKARARNIDIDIEAAKSIAEQTKDTRELEGILLRLYSKLLLTNNVKKITPDMVGEETSRYSPEGSMKRLSPQEVIRNVSAYYQVKPSHIKGTSRKSTISLARQATMYILRIHLHLKFEEIAYILKKKDHTTILHGVEKIKQLTMKNEQFGREIQSIVSSLNS